ncbi:3-oxoacyl-[acyl-carrier-protein] reductase [Wickerhamomyces ciferrii]|uniref:3-oxoacyl-[acyl-carrier-protein] reductase n=1 Tax=Wickerhamomyces ciferrii (strain ATCC 14091 / BCRC 22168 / CBS 111 / JCM 3599 / NBRC 0793 / NRRL Y-1031 F-60-10) TaxID=1206466 RepID=K0KHI4_WICCF|nr:3-oxoacyl-[acyl-carrier-protein] reductase [Wickerhamomyces ciferrii]CCH44675.1 3-oxoacyl-[acyl-carrier-protein] reductase [Wickerhamomyces ciferrii]
MHTALAIKAYIYRKTLYTNWLISYLSDSIIGIVLEKHRDVVLVTGGTQGLGRQIVLEFLKRGVQRIVVFDIKEPAEKHRLDGVYYYQCDVSDKNEVLEMSEKVKSQIGIVTVVINNAGITSGKSFIDLSLEEIEKIIQVNLMSNFYINKAFLPDMLDLKRGYIITVASVLGYMSPSNLGMYFLKFYFR